MTTQNKFNCLVQKKNGAEFMRYGFDVLPFRIRKRLCEAKVNLCAACVNRYYHGSGSNVAATLNYILWMETQALKDEHDNSTQSSFE